MLTIGTIKELIQLGGGVRIDAKHYAAADLKACALLAGGSKAQLVVANAKALAIADMNIMARNASGQVIFELNS